MYKITHIYMYTSIKIWLLLALQEQILNFQKGIAGKFTPEQLKTIQADHARFEAEYSSSPLIAVGSPFPDGNLLDAHGTPTTLSATRNGKAALIVFYRGAWCPFCSITLKTYEQKVHPALTSKGITLIALSPQKPDGTLSAIEKISLTFPVLSDPGNQIARALGIVVRHSDDTHKIQATVGHNLTQVNADGTYDIPIPGIFLIDASGKIKWSDVRPNYTKRIEPVDILKAVDSL